MRSVPHRRRPSSGLAAGVVLLAVGTACGGGQQTRGDAEASPPPVPDGFVAHDSDGIGYALPDDFGDRPAQVEILVADDTADSVDEVARDALAVFQRDTRLTYTDREYEYPVPGAEDAQRSDYEFSGEYAPDLIRRPDGEGATADPSEADGTPSPTVGDGDGDPEPTDGTDDTDDTVRGVDVAMLLDDGTGVTFRITAADRYLDDALADRIIGTLYVMG
ncbi:hypothetical protein HNR23_000657 [Nocardiopsis mwathae]|uniref:Uncharacterized protein n=1 Tax=Nocardiopsis mwathae TaxID=1472723 RepID=A0A7X0D3U8_9ACTN|nr:hypothetical protein [Nocardiopsis mwathae]MBB6170597.1 hypothetical protein [Nocardiopsis mwathae]